MTPCETIFCSSCFNLSFMWILHFLGASMKASVSSFNRSLASPAKFPTVSNCCGQACFKSFMSRMTGCAVDFVSCVSASVTLSTWKVTRFNCSLVGRPTIAGPGTSTTYRRLPSSTSHPCSCSTCRSYRGIEWSRHCMRLVGRWLLVPTDEKNVSRTSAGMFSHVGYFPKRLYLFLATKYSSSYGSLAAVFSTSCRPRPVIWCLDLRCQETWDSSLQRRILVGRIHHRFHIQSQVRGHLCFSCFLGCVPMFVSQGAVRTPETDFPPSIIPKKRHYTTM